MPPDGTTSNPVQPVSIWPAVDHHPINAPSLDDRCSVRPRKKKTFFFEVFECASSQAAVERLYDPDHIRVPALASAPLACLPPGKQTGRGNNKSFVPVEEDTPGKHTQETGTRLNESLLSDVLLHIKSNNSKGDEPAPRTHGDEKRLPACHQQYSA
ncbi:hypothetical protein SKAU_G00078860 [Synaphobranchus kaupii]|uniref:Uncharacterized protein n=1 Tax=Synaphobranchus kaupii TaxID=118154 RepID=A0A9Q1FV95_SYNKA|nr:hypothetical protein SKAU_G00078860 [Synaphobranchus kaupii]